MEKNSDFSSESLNTTSEINFECPCGKTYKSYPAIFTHVKNKHEGKVISTLF
jgi:hypothetical protein